MQKYRHFSKDINSKMALGEVGVSFPWWCQAIEKNSWWLGLNLIIFQNAKIKIHYSGKYFRPNLKFWNWILIFAFKKNIRFYPNHQLLLSIYFKVYQNHFINIKFTYPWELDHTKNAVMAKVLQIRIFFRFVWLKIKEYMKFKEIIKKYILSS